jgi:hypothetical protein
VINWTPELEDEIARRLITRSLTKICEEDSDLPSRNSIQERMLRNEAFWAKCAHARKMHAYQRLEDVERDVDSCNADNANAVRVKADYARWLAERLLSKDYSNKIDVNVTSSIADAIADARKRAK